MRDHDHVSSKYQIDFPRAYGTHPDNHVEWLYFTALLHDADDRPISFFFTLFITPTMTFPVLHLLDLDSGALLLHAEGIDPAPGHDIEAGISVAAYGEPGTLTLRHLGGGGYRIDATLPERDADFRLELRPTSAPVLHGEAGIVQMSTNGPSAYFTLLALRAEGSLRVGDRQRPLHGEVWHDHQWGDFAYGPDGFDQACFLYDWFSCRFDDGSTLMVYRFRDAAGHQLEGRQVITYTDADGQCRTLQQLRLSRGTGRFTPQRFPGEAYTTTWELEVPELGLTIGLEAACQDQLIEQASTGEHYYSGVFWIDGDRRGYAYGELGLPGTSQGSTETVASEPPAHSEPVRPGHGWADGGLARLWPSVGEYPAYDAFAYALMEGDAVRNRLYQRAIEALAPGRVALDIGTGRELLWARACLRAGARHVYAVEQMPATFEQARQTIERHGLGDRITLLLGRSDELELPEPVDLCVSEIIGCIGSAEGVCAILDDARRRHLRPGGSMIPARCQTRIAAATLPEGLHPRPRFEEAAAGYARRIFEHSGRPFDVRVLVENLGRQHLLSGGGEVFEDLRFDRATPAIEARHVTLPIEREGRLDGFALWVRLWCEPGGDPLDAMRDEVSWIPVFVPAFYPGLPVRPGDQLEVECRRDCSDDGVHPDYQLEGTLHTASGPRPFRCGSPYVGTGFRASPFYQELFGDWS